MRTQFVSMAAGIMGFGLGGAVGVAVYYGMVRRLRPLPLWVVGTQFIGLRVMVRQDILVIFQGREWMLDLGGLCLLSARFCILHTVTVKGVHRWISRVCVSLVILTAAAAVFQLGATALDRAGLSRKLPGPTALLRGARALFDFDGDGYSAVLGGLDCDDGNPEVHPQAIEIVANGVDDNCGGGDLLRFEPNEPPPVTHHRGLHNIVFVSVDAFRADAFGPERADDVDLTPRLSAFARNAAVFTRAYVNATATDCSLRSMMTGHYPMDFTNDRYFFGQELSIAEHVKALGYATLALNQIWLLQPYTFQGFQFIDDRLSELNRNFAGVTSEITTDLALSYLQKLRTWNRPYFLWIHYFDPHSLYLPHKDTPVRGDSLLDNYRREIFITDRAMGRFLDELGRIDFLSSGYVVVFGDHGELLGEEGRFGHGWWVDEEVLRVPLIIAGPQVKPGVYSPRVGLVDVYTTVLELAASVAARSDGRSLAHIWNGEETGDRDIFVHNGFHGMNERVCIVRDWKYIVSLRNGTEFLYNLEEDPNEDTNLVGSRPEVLEQMRDHLWKRMDRSTNSVMMIRKIAQLQSRLLPREITERWKRETNKLSKPVPPE